MRPILALALLTAACSSGEPLAPLTPAADQPLEVEARDTTTVEPGVLREVFEVGGHVPPPNPTTGEATPPELNRTRIVRFRPEQAEGPVRAVVVVTPGMWAGAGSVSPLARSIVRRGVGSGDNVEVWAVDRRSNLLEDLDGFAAAEEAGDPELAADHLRGRVADWPRADQLSFMSEWGLETHVEDLRRVLALIPGSSQRVILAGHSLGAMFTRAFAGYRFPDGVRGSELIAGAVLLDNAPFYETLTPEQYRQGPGNAIEEMPLTIPGIEATRRSTPINNPFGASRMALLQVAALRARLTPAAPAVDASQRQVLGYLILSGPDRVPAVSHRVSFGLMFDDETSLMTAMSAGIGRLDGPVEPYQDPVMGGELMRPADPDAEYGWIDADATSPPETTSMVALAEAVGSGPTNMLEWYFPNRLMLDCMAVASGDVAEEPLYLEHGLRVFDGDSADVPVLAIATAFPGHYRKARDILPPGTDFRELEATHLTHMEAAVANDGPGNPIPAAVMEFTIDVTRR